MHFHFFFFTDTATTEIYTLSLHDALPIYGTHEDFDDRSVELGVAAALQFGEGVGSAARFFVSAVAGDRVVGVGNGDDARTDRDVLAGERLRITRAVVKLVVMQDHFPNASERS